MSITPYEIPLTSEPQRFNVFLGGVEYTIRLYWNEAEQGGWIIDIKNTATGEDLINGIPLVRGINLLKPYKYIGINGGLAVFSDVTNLPAGFDTLGTDVKLYFLSYDE